MVWSCQKSPWGITAFAQAGQNSLPVAYHEESAPAPSLIVWGAVCRDPLLWGLGWHLASWGASSPMCTLASCRKWAAWIHIKLEHPHLQHRCVQVGYTTVLRDGVYL